MRPLRIAHVTATFPPYPGGTGNVCYYQARELARRGHSVTVLTAAVPGAAAPEAVNIDADGLRVRRLRPLLRVGNAPLLPGLVAALRGYDLIHLHAPFIAGGELTALAAALTWTPLIITYHNDLVGDGSWRDMLFQLAGLGLRATLRSAARVLFVSSGHAQSCAQAWLLAQGADRWAVLPNGIDITLFRPAADRPATRRRLGFAAEQPLIGFVGGLDRAHHYKGLDLLIAALAAPALAQAQLLIVGDGDLRPAYEQRAAALRPGGRVRFHGAATQADLPALYRACDLVAMPSLAAESFGLVLAEALACGVPVVASDSPGVRSLVEPGQSGLLVPPGDRAALVFALVGLLADPDLRATIGRQGRARIVTGFTWERVGDQLEALYGEILRPPATGRTRVGGVR